MSNILLQLSRFLKLFFLLPILGGFVYVECAIAEPFVNDPKLKVELVASDLQFPTSMAFLGPDDILVLEKNNGTVQRIIDGVKQEDPILDVSVANKNERGMLGIASMIETAVENRTLQDP
ncbi:MAG TPA: hypothetical protein VE548_07110, partial [Nitrososphaeraceae archaeon]|nr:hypothetical protein [Nitrososphaeraceae archaeon]